MRWPPPTASASTASRWPSSTCGPVEAQLVRLDRLLENLTPNFRHC